MDNGYWLRDAEEGYRWYEKPSIIQTDGPTRVVTDKPFKKKKPPFLGFTNGTAQSPQRKRRTSS